MKKENTEDGKLSRPEKGTNKTLRNYFLEKCIDLL